MPKALALYPHHNPGRYPQVGELKELIKGVSPQPESAPLPSPLPAEKQQACNSTLLGDVHPMCTPYVHPMCTLLPPAPRHARPLAPHAPSRGPRAQS